LESLGVSKALEQVPGQALEMELALHDSQLRQTDPLWNWPGAVVQGGINLVPRPFLPGVRLFWLGATPEGGPIAAGVCTGARRCCAGWRLPRKGVAGRGCAARPWGNPLRSWSRWRRGCCAEQPLPQWRAADPGQRRLGAAVDRGECFNTVGKGTLPVNRSPAAAE